MRYRKYDIRETGQTLSCEELGLYGFGRFDLIAKAIDRETFVPDLANALAGAEMAAELADPGDGLQNDGGSCNFDTPMVCRHGLRKSQIARVFALCGIEIQKGYRAGQWLITGFGLKGQAMRRTLMAEAAGRFLSDAGFNAGVHYAVD